MDRLHWRRPFPFKIIYISLKTHQLFKIDQVVMKGLISFMNKGDVCNRNTLLAQANASELREHAARLQHTFEQQWEKRNLWCLHLLKRVSVGFVIQRWILWRCFQIKPEQICREVEDSATMYWAEKHLLWWSPVQKRAFWISQEFSVKIKVSFLKMCVELSEYHTVEKKEHLYLPRLTQAADGCSVQTHNNGKETVEVPLSFTARE